MRKQVSFDLDKESNTLTLDLYVELNSKLSMGKPYCMWVCLVFSFQYGNKFHRQILQHVGGSVSFTCFKSAAWQFYLMLFEKNKNVLRNIE